jgi:RNA polymerase sigma-54 factor
MKQTLGLRVSQHLALTPQLQQSIRLLQLSTLELAQEIEQALQDNPFLEPELDAPGHEETLQAERDQIVMDEPNATELIAGSAHSDWADSPFSSENPSNSSAADAESPSTDLTQDIGSDWEGDGSLPIAHDDSEWGVEARARSSAATSDEDSDPANWRGEHISLQAHLHRQALGLRLSDEDKAALAILIESLNDEGYLEDSFDDLALALGARTLEDIEELVARFQIAIRHLQQFEPTGVGARDLAECLRLQLMEMPARTPAIQTALAVLQQPLDLLARRDVRKLCSACSAPEAEIKTALGLIARLDPKPGRQFVDVERHVITPDVIVTPERKNGSRPSFRVQLNPDVLPRIRVSDMYASALKSVSKSEGRANAKGEAKGEAKSDGKSEGVVNLQGRLQEARWFIKNIQQRFDTILRVASAIVERQHNFFVHGAVAMRPLVLREIADQLGLHESTISRVTTAKYMATPWGTFELKYFFGSALATETGGNASSTAVRELIKQFIDHENKAKPLSDNAIADMLKEQGIECARRTVAKYREAMRIAPTSLRKTL